MFKTFLKYHMYDFCINTFFENIKKNFPMLGKQRKAELIKKLAQYAKQYNHLLDFILDHDLSTDELANRNGFVSKYHDDANDFTNILYKDEIFWEEGIEEIKDQIRKAELIIQSHNTGKG